MRLFHALRSCIPAAAFCLCLYGQNAPGGAAPVEAKGLPPRAAPTDYQSRGKAGNVTIAAEFKGHAIPTEEATLKSEEYIVVEVGLYGPAGERLTISFDNFSLRLNGKKDVLPSVPFGLVLATVKDPEWQPPKSESKPKTSFGGSGQPGESEPYREPKVPLELQRAMGKRVQKATLAEGDRALPQAGLLYFQYRGKTQKIHSVELIYSGPAGQATIPLQP